MYLTFSKKTNKGISQLVKVSLKHFIAAFQSDLFEATVDGENGQVFKVSVEVF